MVDTFIRRPILASVCSLVLILAGVVAIPTMPVAQYPALAPPQVTVTAFYTGANAQEVETSVTTPLEQAINGVEGMLYMTSSSTNTRRGDDQRDVRHHAGPGSRPDRRPEPRQPGTRPHAGGSPHHRHHRPEADDRLRDGRGRVHREGGVRLAVPEQLPGRLRQGRVEARARRGRRADLRRAQVRDAAVARSGSHGRAASDRGGRGLVVARAERAGSRRQSRPGAGTCRPDVSAERPRRRPAARGVGVREHHRQERRRRFAGPRERRGPRRARRRNLFRAAALPGGRSRRFRREPAADRECARRRAGRVR